MDWQIFVIPQDSFVVFIKRLSLAPFFLCHHTFSVLCGFFVVCPYVLYLLYFIWFGVQGGKCTLSCATEGLVFLQLWSEKCGCCA